VAALDKSIADNRKQVLAAAQEYAIKMPSWVARTRDASSALAAIAIVNESSSTTLKHLRAVFDTIPAVLSHAEYENVAPVFGCEDAKQSTALVASMTETQRILSHLVQGSATAHALLTVVAGGTVANFPPGLPSTSKVPVIPVFEFKD